MNISIHLATSLILTAILFPFVGFYSLWIIVGGYLIDFDHFLWTAYKSKKYSVKKSYKDHYNRRYNPNYERDLLHIFHTVEFWIFMIFIAIVSNYFNFVFIYYMFTITFIGMLLHLTLDFTDLIKGHHLDARAISWIGWFKRNKRR